MSIDRMIVKGFRGVKSEGLIDLTNKSSLLLYGDNATGKSSFLDAVEWFITDKVSHLSGEEVEVHGGLRYALNTEQDECSVEIHFSNPRFQKKKVLIQSKDKLKAEFTDKLTEPENLFLELISRDRSWIRNSDLIKFVLGTKSQRLSDISSIIGFDQVAETKITLKKSANDIKATIKAKNFPALIASEQNTILRNLNSLVTSEAQFIEASNAIIKPFALDTQPSSLAELEVAIKALASKGSESEVKKAISLNRVIAAQNQLKTSIEIFRQNYSEYILSRNSFQADTERLSKLNEKSLLDYALKLLEHHQKDNCPLCLQVFSREELKKQIVKRLQELEKIRTEFDTLTTKSKNLSLTCGQIALSIKAIITNSGHLSGDESGPSVEDLKSSNITFENFLHELLQLPVDQQTCVIPMRFEDNILESGEKLEKLAVLQLAELNQNTSSQLADIVSKLSIAVNAFRRIQQLSVEQNILNSQAKTLNSIVSEFTKIQRQEMTSFLKKISSSINEYYLFMNPSEKVDDIQLVCLDDKNGEFVGLSVQFSFHGKSVDSPKKFLSESHLNALGLCLFFSTVRVFNKSSKFIILDDVISSFDKAHRTMFARLLIEKFNDFQLLIFTHEFEWYDYLSSLVKGRQWRILKTNWSSENGTVLSLSADEIRKRIEKKIQESDESDLGNLIRQCGERSLKEIAEMLGVPIAFKFNDKNELRLFDELYSAIRSYIKKKSPSIGDAPEIAALSTCQFFSNRSSHDSGYHPNINDLKIAWRDLENFCNMFRCSDCERFVDVALENVIAKNITCRCGKKSLPWK